MLRAVNRQQIFFDTEDYCYFSNLLVKYKSISSFKLHAFCLMGNHVHLLIQVQDEPLDQLIKRFENAFVYWYNAKYHRTGHLFQDRFRSEPVEDDVYFLTVLRYILRNPVEAGLCTFPQEYIYGSARDYLMSENGITDTEHTFSMIGAEELKSYVLQKNDDQCLKETEGQSPCPKGHGDCPSVSPQKVDTTLSCPGS